MYMLNNGPRDFNTVFKCTEPLGGEMYSAVCVRVCEIKMGEVILNDNNNSTAHQLKCRMTLPTTAAG